MIGALFVVIGTIAGRPGQEVVSLPGAGPASADDDVLKAAAALVNEDWPDSGVGSGRAPLRVAHVGHAEVGWLRQQKLGHFVDPGLRCLELLRVDTLSDVLIVGQRSDLGRATQSHSGAVVPNVELDWR